MKRIAVIMGSGSDLSVMQEAADKLAELNVPFEVRVISAHRTPKAAMEFAQGAEQAGFGVLIAGAGKAAHLAGMLAANTTMPVIGVPIKGEALEGLDALLSTVQMPSGIPVATVAINEATNAALLAAEILALTDDELSAKLKAMRESLRKVVEQKDQEVALLYNK